MSFQPPEMPPQESLAAMPSFLAHYVVDEGDRARVKEALAAVPTTPGEWAELLSLFATLGRDFGRQPSHPLARRLANAFVDTLLAPGCTLEGAENLEGDGPQLVIANHLGYADTLAIRQLLVRAHRLDLADRISAVAGPKVYENTLRLLAVASHPSIHVAQSSQISDGKSARSLVKITRRCLADCAALLDEGALVVLFAEGTRSRDQQLQPFIKGVARWVTQPGLTVVPVGHWGSEGLYSVDGDRLGVAEVHVRVGAPIDVDALKAEGLGRSEILAAVHEALEALLPDAYRGTGKRLR